MTTKAEPIPESVVNNSSMNISSSSSIVEVKDDAADIINASSSNVINAASSDISQHHVSPLRYTTTNTSVEAEISKLNTQQLDSTPAGTEPHELASFEVVSENEMSKLLDIQTSEK